MKFDEKVKILIDEIEVPECISPDNIAVMLKEKKVEKEIKPDSSAISMKTHNKGLTTRYIGAVAACVALALGITAYLNHGDGTLVKSNLETDVEVVRADNYSDVYKAQHDNIVKGGIPVDNPVTDNLEKKVDNDKGTTAIIYNVDEDVEKTITDYSIATDNLENVDKADILKADGDNLYYIANNSLYVAAQNGGNLALIAKILPENLVPVEIYINGDKLIVLSDSTNQTVYSVSPKTAVEESATISETSETQQTDSTENSEVPIETAETSEITAEETTVISAETTSESIAEKVQSEVVMIPQDNVVINVYDISDKANITLLSQYRQNGKYISSRMIGGYIYIVSDYENCQTKPLGSEDDLDNYVPGYYIGEAKKYVEANDIYIPSKINSSNYTVISAFDGGSDAGLKSINAVMGDCINMYATSENIYIFGSGSVANSKDISYIMQFTIASGEIAYSKSAVVDGKFLNQYSINYYNDNLRVATATDKDNNKYTNLYVFNKKLESVVSKTEVLKDKAVKLVRFVEDKVYVVTKEDEIPLQYQITAKGIELASQNKENMTSAFLKKYSENRLLGTEVEYNEDGKAISRKLIMYDSTDKNSLKEIASISIDGQIPASFSEEIINRQSIFIDNVNNIIGISLNCTDKYGINNMYYFVKYEEGKGFSEFGKLSYLDIPSSKNEFNRAVLIGNVYYIFSKGRIVSVNASDFKVIALTELK